MKLRLSTILKILAFITCFAFWACSDKNEEVWNEIPQPIALFIDEYWPGSFARDYSADKTGYNVLIANGPELIFDTDYKWTTVDGNGMPLPQMFLYDQLPDKLYDYLESGEYTDQVFEVVRDARYYHVKLLTQNLVYIIATESVTSS